MRWLADCWTSLQLIHIVNTGYDWPGRRRRFLEIQVLRLRLWLVRLVEAVEVSDLPGCWTRLHRLQEKFYMLWLARLLNQDIENIGSTLQALIGQAAETACLEIQAVRHRHWRPGFRNKLLKASETELITYVITEFSDWKNNEIDLTCFLAITISPLKSRKNNWVDRPLYFNTPWYIAVGFAGPWAKILACKPF